MKTLFTLFLYYSFEAFASFYLATHYTNNLWITHITTIVEYSIIAFVFALWSKRTIARRLMLASIPLFWSICAIAMLSVEKITHSGSFSTPLEGMLLASMGVHSLLDFIDDYNGSLIRDPKFWVSACVVLYSLGTAPYFAVYNILGMTSREMAFAALAVNWVLSIVANALYATAFFVDHSVVLAVRRVRDSAM